MFSHHRHTDLIVALALGLGGVIPSGTVLAAAHPPSLSTTLHQTIQQFQDLKSDAGLSPKSYPIPGSDPSHWYGDTAQGILAAGTISNEGGWVNITLKDLHTLTRAIAQLKSYPSNAWTPQDASLYALYRTDWTTVLQPRTTHNMKISAGGLGAICSIERRTQGQFQALCQGACSAHHAANVAAAFSASIRVPPLPTSTPGRSPWSLLVSLFVGATGISTLALWRRARYNAQSAKTSFPRRPRAFGTNYAVSHGAMWPASAAVFSMPFEIRPQGAPPLARSERTLSPKGRVHRDWRPRPASLCTSDAPNRRPHHGGRHCGRSSRSRCAG